MTGKQIARAVAVGSAVAVLGSACTSGDSRAGDDSRLRRIAPGPSAGVEPAPTPRGSSSNTSSSTTSSTTSTSSSSASTTSPAATSAVGSHARTTIVVDGGAFVVDAPDGVLRVVERSLEPGWEVVHEVQSAERLHLELASGGDHLVVEVTVVDGGLRSVTHQVSG